MTDVSPKSTPTDEPQAQQQPPPEAHQQGQQQQAQQQRAGLWPRAVADLLARSRRLSERSAQLSQAAADLSRRIDASQRADDKA